MKFKRIIQMSDNTLVNIISKISQVVIDTSLIKFKHKLQFLR